jgi:hypothetical protein
LKDYIGPNVKLPDWGVPDKWCTRDALTLVQKIGHWLVTDGMLSDVTSRAHIQVIGDSKTQRTVDTAYALAMGLADGFQSRNANATKQTMVTVGGLGQLDYDPWLFQPLNKDPLSFKDERNKGEDTSERINGALCQKGYTERELRSSISRRLIRLPPPTRIPEALEFLMSIAGVGPAGNLTEVFPSTPKMAQNWENLEGGPALLKLIAQMAFYSRAGNLSDVFLPHLTNDQIYQLLLPWVYWTRDVGHVNNPREATTGAALARALTHVLAHGNLHGSSEIHDDDNDATFATIVVGHDNDLDALATALGVSWEAPPLYKSYPHKYLVTPPVSGIHAKHTVAAGRNSRIDLSYLCPVFSSLTNNDQWILNDSGILEQSPLQWSDSLVAAQWKTSSDSRSTYLDGRMALEQFPVQVRHSLDPYSGAGDCWEAMGTYLEPRLVGNDATDESSPSPGTCTFALEALGAIGLAACAAWGCVRRFNSQRERVYEGIDAYKQDAGPLAAERNAGTVTEHVFELALLSRGI